MIGLTRAWRVACLTLALASAACATASDVARRGRALEARLDPIPRSYCPPEPLAQGLAEVAFARAASERGDALAAASHLARAEAYAVEVEAITCGVPGSATEPPRPPLPAPPDLDQDGVPDQADPDDDGDGINDTIDQCPTAPEDTDGVEDIDGCPEPA